MGILWRQHLGHGPVGRGPAVTSKRRCFVRLVSEEETWSGWQEKMDILGQDSQGAKQQKGYSLGPAPRFACWWPFKVMRISHLTLESEEEV